MSRPNPESLYFEGNDRGYFQKSESCPNLFVGVQPIRVHVSGRYRILGNRNPSDGRRSNERQPRGHRRHSDRRASTIVTRMLCRCVTSLPVDRRPARVDRRPRFMRRGCRFVASWCLNLVPCRRFVNAHLRRVVRRWWSGYKGNTWVVTMAFDLDPVYSMRR